MKQSLDKYNKMPVSKAVIQNALPAVAAMLMVLIYNLADTFFIGQTHDAYQVAAVSLATPVFFGIHVYRNHFWSRRYICYFKVLWRREKRVCQKSMFFLYVELYRNWNFSHYWLSFIHGALA